MLTFAPPPLKGDGGMFLYCSYIVPILFLYRLYRVGEKEKNSGNASC